MSRWSSSVVSKHNHLYPVTDGLKYPLLDNWGNHRNVDSINNRFPYKTNRMNIVLFFDHTGTSGI